MNAASLIRFALLLPPLALGSGCATHALWTHTEQLDALKEPADNPNLRLFDARRHDDLLVVYDEYSERGDAIHTRAYWVHRNEKRVEQRREPAFVSTRSAHGLVAVPVFATTNIFETDPQSVYAILSADHRSFTVFSTGHPTVSYPLPVYDDGSGRAIRIAFTPLAVAADITIVGGVIGYLCLEGMARSGYQYSL